MLSHSVAQPPSWSQEAADNKWQNQYKASVNSFEMFVRYALKQFWRFLNNLFRSNWLKYICTRTTQEL